MLPSSFSTSSSSVAVCSFSADLPGSRIRICLGLQWAEQDTKRAITWQQHSAAPGFSGSQIMQQTAFTPRGQLANVLSQQQAFPS